MRAETASNSSTTRRSLDRQSSRQRSRITNGRSLLPDVDGRSLLARRFRDIQNAIVADQGGPEHLSEARLQLIRRFAASAVLAEQLESKLANGEEIDVSQHALLCSSLVRLANKIGINRIAKDITPSLSDILREHGHDGAVAD
jgi:hypothetical protein